MNSALAACGILVWPPRIDGKQVFGSMFIKHDQIIWDWASVGASGVSSTTGGEHSEFCWRSRTADEKRAAEGYKQLISAGTGALYVNGILRVDL